MISAEVNNFGVAVGVHFKVPVLCGKSSNSLENTDNKAPVVSGITSHDYVIMIMLETGFACAPQMNTMYSSTIMEIHLWSIYFGLTNKIFCIFLPFTWLDHCTAWTGLYLYTGLTFTYTFENIRLHACGIAYATHAFTGKRLTNSLIKFEKRLCHEHSAISISLI